MPIGGKRKKKKKKEVPKLVVPKVEIKQKGITLEKILCLFLFRCPNNLFYVHTYTPLFRNEAGSQESVFHLQLKPESLRLD